MLPQREQRGQEAGAVYESIKVLRCFDRAWVHDFVRHADSRGAVGYFSIAKVWNNTHELGETYAVIDQLSELTSALRTPRLANAATC